MKAAGVIVEYNPFHNGHAYHLQQTKKATDADCIIAVMSGQFLQRGEPALVSKWARTEMALAAGIDVVVELPYHFATQNAETFARGAISILDAINCQDFCFGSENGTIHEFLETYVFLNDHNKQFKLLLKQHLKKGLSFPKATSLAYSDLNEDVPFLDLAKPNNILGYYYVKALKELNSDLQAQTIKRTGADYHDEAFTSKSIASATSIRKSLFSVKNNLNEINKYVPKTSKTILEDYFAQFTLYHNWELYFSFLKYKLLTLSQKELQEICEIEEGIENRLKNYIVEATTFHEFMNLVKTKRYTWTRIQRICLHILTHTYKESMQQKYPTYIRLLGMSQKGQQYLKINKKKFSLPLIANVSRYDDPMLNLDIKATYTFGSILPEPIRSKFLKMEYTIPPIKKSDV